MKRKFRGKYRRDIKGKYKEMRNKEMRNKGIRNKELESCSTISVAVHILIES